ncbi:MAG: DUF4126 domain-containing protein [Actinomycetota bacterium]|nr:DUF4126 domain-containing protein [Actinomycetota bacterium]
MEFLPMVFASGWASGVNAYAVVVLLGLLGRFAGVDGVPAALERTDVLVIAAVLYVAEFVADKIPYVDTAWDAVHTAVRPTVGAFIGLLVSGDASSPEQAIAATTGGTTALVSHAVKASLRMAVNTSPEPASNIGVSLVEDFSVAGVVTLAVFHPWVAASIAGVLLLLGIALAVFLLRRIRRFRAARRERRAAAT